MCFRVTPDSMYILRPFTLKYFFPALVFLEFGISSFKPSVSSSAKSVLSTLWSNAQLVIHSSRGNYRSLAKGDLSIHLPFRVEVDLACFLNYDILGHNLSPAFFHESNNQWDSFFNGEIKSLSPLSFGCVKLVHLSLLI